MTCIVGVKQDGEIYIGGDSAGVSGMDIKVRKDTKVFRNGPFVMGFTSSFRMGQLLRHVFEPPTLPDTNLDQYMAKDFVRKVKQCFDANNWSGEEARDGGVFLVGVRDQLYSIFSDYQVANHADGYNAVGCGGMYALGSLYTTNSYELDAKTRVREALKAASHHSAGVAPPYTILKVRS
jgi:ATP-dependent protease HslVU (ClpYQ) peptidase subunit